AVGLDHRQVALILLLELAVLKAQSAHQFDASDLEPHEVVRVINDTHLVGFRIADTDGSGVGWRHAFSVAGDAHREAGPRRCYAVLSRSIAPQPSVTVNGTTVIAKGRKIRTSHA